MDACSQKVCANNNYHAMQNIILWSHIFSVVEQGNSATNPAVMVNDNKALSILLPITLIIIATLIITVGVLVYLLVRKQRAKKDAHPDSGYIVTFLERSQRSLGDEHSSTVTGMEGMRYLIIVLL